MKYVGVDLHKHVISACVVIQQDGKRKVMGRLNLRCKETENVLVVTSVNMLGIALRTKARILQASTSRQKPPLRNRN